MTLILNILAASFLPIGLASAWVALRFRSTRLALLSFGIVAFAVFVSLATGR